MKKIKEKDEIKKDESDLKNERFEKDERGGKKMKAKR